MPSDGICRLRPSPEDPNCDFKAAAGDTVTVEVKDVAGSVDIASAKYNDAALPGTPGKSVTFTVVAGSKDLELVFIFSDPADGRGELHEVCAGNPFLANIRASNKAVAFTICA